MPAFVLCVHQRDDRRIRAREMPLRTLGIAAVARVSSFSGNRCRAAASAKAVAAVPIENAAGIGHHCGFIRVYAEGCETQVLELATFQILAELLRRNAGEI